MSAQVVVPAANVADLLSVGYSRIEIWRSASGTAAYEEVTASTATPARVDSFDASTTFPMGGRLLEFSLNGNPDVSVEFSSLLKNWTPEQVAARVNEVSSSTASVVGKKVRLSTANSGRGTKVSISHCDTEALFLTGASARGLDARLQLAVEDLVYVYTDAGGAEADLYKWRLSVNGLEPVSPFSSPSYGQPLPSSSVQTSVATAFFLGLNGSPQKRRVIVGSTQPPNSVDGSLVGSSTPLVVEADSSGFLQIRLVQGAKVWVAIEGTAFVRELTVPATASFDLLAAMTAAPDPYTVQTPPPFLIRRSL